MDRGKDRGYLVLRVAFFERGRGGWVSEMDWRILQGKIMLAKKVSEGRWRWVWRKGVGREGGGNPGLLKETMLNPGNLIFLKRV